MNRISRELLSIAREINALDEEGDGSGFQPYHDYENAEQTRLDIAQKEGKKYILHHKEGNLWRIMACKKFFTKYYDAVEKGELGGLIESEKNLSHDDRCWVTDDAKVYANAQVYDNALISDTAQVRGSAKVCGNAQVWGSAQVFGFETKVDGYAQVWGSALVFDGAQIYDSAQVKGDARVCGKNTKVYDQATVCGNASISDGAKIHGKAIVNYNVKDYEITE